jgi:inorganic pyrophosphatase
LKPSRKKRKGHWIRNDRLIAVATHAKTYETAENLEELTPHLVEEIKEFFVDYNKLEDRKFDAKAEVGPSKAKSLIETALRNLKKDRRTS